jgi:hypothetical protein
MRSSFHRSGKPTEVTNGRTQHRVVPAIFILAAFIIMAGWLYLLAKFLILLLSKFAIWLIS